MPGDDIDGVAVEVDEIHAVEQAQHLGLLWSDGGIFLVIPRTRMMSPASAARDSGAGRQRIASLKCLNSLPVSAHDTERTSIPGSPGENDAKP
ncbi:hypothetical protein ebA2972 [Aromatoleum aromaticum EbN1]|uniref:Uncharacterized protein n=1 Tax=Aromatoleum aromaticum (strain DSM 19018 / LMG 30748 / EbN1) TaxID=76114 RepID=Q5P4G5_AROAE|nr:hypothetical protein ebA2972 [Aromatoleum aromaticum EbN1]